MGKRILLVEGKDDWHVMANLFKVRRAPINVFKLETPGVEGHLEGDGGIEVLLESIPARLLESDLERLAVIVDANAAGAVARWQSIVDRLVKKSYDASRFPVQCGSTGAVVELSVPGTPRSVRFGVWIMPNNRSGGMLEDFVAGLIRPDDAMLPRVDQFLDSLPAEIQRFSDTHRAKARIHTWLATSERPGRPMGQAIKADARIDAHHPTVQSFLDWVYAVLVDETNPLPQTSSDTNEAK